MAIDEIKEILMDNLMDKHGFSEGKGNVTFFAET